MGIARRLEIPFGKLEARRVAFLVARRALFFGEWNGQCEAENNQRKCFERFGDRFVRALVIFTPWAVLSG